MPTYEYKCSNCGKIAEIAHSIKENPEFFCRNCDTKEPLTRLISFNKSGFVIKGGSEAIHWKEKRQRIKNRTKLGVKQIERYGTEGGSRLKPNVGGVEVESWSDAAKIAKDKGLNTDSYKGMVEKEKHTGKSGVDDRKWKAAKEQRDK